MTFLDRAGRILVIAPHPDDEVLGCGGTIARLSESGHEVHVAIVTSGREPRFTAESITRVRNEAHAAHALLGVAKTHWLGQPAAELDTVPSADLNRALEELIQLVSPDTVFVPFAGDIHLDHQLVFRSSLVAMRPRSASYPARILAYETLSETNWSAPCDTASFIPNVSIDIGATLDRKIAAFRCYESQQVRFPHERSTAALGALATLRGATVHRDAAEAFLLIREVG
jgi:LmbE family N-acetylglucosaminyl deacetylase